MTYREIEDIKRIGKLVKRMDAAFTTGARSRAMRRIGYPGGHEHRTVLFMNRNGDDSLWYASWHDQRRDQRVALVGRGDWHGNDWLPIDVQFNFPVEQYNRRKGAAFLEDVETGEEFLAHRGLVTLGSRLRKDIVMEAMAADVVEVQTSVGNDEFLLVCPLLSKHLIKDVGDFAARLRDTVRGLGGPDRASDQEAAGDIVPTSDDTGPPKPFERGSDPLQAYFDEFSGQRRTFVPKMTTAVCLHGHVVRALHDAVITRAKTWKSRAVDLVAELTESALLFEVKTAVDTQSVYCAIGQLAIHEPAVGRCLNKPVRRILVVPALPQQIMAETLERALGVVILTYSIDAARNVTFCRLDDLFD
jgi:hypothetical protein